MLNTTLMPNPAATRFKSMTIEVKADFDFSQKDKISLTKAVNKFDENDITIRLEKEQTPEVLGNVYLELHNEKTDSNKFLGINLPASAYLKTNFNTLFNKANESQLTKSDMTEILNSSLKDISSNALLYKYGESYPLNNAETTNTVALARKVVSFVESLPETDTIKLLESRQQEQNPFLRLALKPRPEAASN